MNNNEQYTVMVARCEATARALDHALDVWYPVSEHLRASLCKVCGAMVWVTRPDNGAALANRGASAPAGVLGL